MPALAVARTPRSPAGERVRSNNAWNSAPGVSRREALVGSVGAPASITPVHTSYLNVI